MSCAIEHLECYIVPLLAGLILFLLSLFIFSNKPLIDALIKSFILAAILFILCALFMPSEPIYINIKG